MSYADETKAVSCFVNGFWQVDPLVSSKVAMEDPSFIDGFPIKTMLFPIKKPWFFP